jgi:hypothetical protein
MVDVFAALSLAAAASKQENPSQLFSDAELLYGAYSDLKAGKLSVDQLEATGKLKPLVQAAARLTAVANVLVDDPDQVKNITALISSV